MGSHVPVLNKSMNKMIYEMNHILNCGYEIKRRYDLNFSGFSTQLLKGALSC